MPPQKDNLQPPTVESIQSEIQQAGMVVIDGHVVKNPYQVLGLTAECSDRQIADAFRKRCKVLIPSGSHRAESPQNQALLLEINTAYTLLKKLAKSKFESRSEPSTTQEYWWQDLDYMSFYDQIKWFDKAKILVTLSEQATELRSLSGLTAQSFDNFIAALDIAIARHCTETPSPESKTQLRTLLTTDLPQFYIRFVSTLAALDPRDNVQYRCLHKSRGLLETDLSVLGIPIDTVALHSMNRELARVLLAGMRACTDRNQAVFLERTVTAELPQAYRGLSSDVFTELESLRRRFSLR